MEEGTTLMIRGVRFRSPLNLPLALLQTFIPIVLVAASPVDDSTPGTRSEQAPPETYKSAEIDPDGNLRILTSDFRTIVVPKGGGSRAGDTFGAQKAFGTPVLSDDRGAVGAQALFENCCTSYDIPLQLVIYSRGRAHRFEGGLAIFEWHFADRGTRVVFSQQTVHFACEVHWELRDIAMERLVAQTDIPEPCGQLPDPPPVSVPGWVKGNVSGIK